MRIHVFMIIYLFSREGGQRELRRAARARPVATCNILGALSLYIITLVILMS